MSRATMLARFASFYRACRPAEPHRALLIVARQFSAAGSSHDQVASVAPGNVRLNVNDGRLNLTNPTKPGSLFRRICWPANFCGAIPAETASNRTRQANVYWVTAVRSIHLLRCWRGRQCLANHFAPGIKLLVQQILLNSSRLRWVVRFKRPFVHVNRTLPGATDATCRGELPAAETAARQ